MTLTVNEFEHAYKEEVLQLFAESWQEATVDQQFAALASLVKRLSATDWSATKQATVKHATKQVYYFSIEFLPGRMLATNLLNLGILPTVESAFKDMHLNLKRVLGIEVDPGLGNGGLGRLASSFLDAMASIGIDGNGNGLRYQTGLFKQDFLNGYQVELPDDWLRNGYVWETRKIERAVVVRFGGQVSLMPGANGSLAAQYRATENVLAVPYDIPQIGYQNGHVNTMRLWQAEPPTMGQPLTAEQREEISAITQSLYPDDSTEAGRRLRLRQEYFLVSAGLQSIVRHYRRTHQDFSQFAASVAVHINDTHPAMAIPELMRLLLDEGHLDWERAWSITVQVMSYTNHTLLQEALETWSIDLFAPLLPRIYQIIQEIDRRFRDQYRAQYGDDFVNAIAPLGNNTVRMAYLAVLGSHAVNGVAALHTQLLEESVLNGWYQLVPERFSNQTNGITLRRWVQLANRPLAKLLDKTIGTHWRQEPLAIEAISQFGDQPKFLAKLNAAKLKNKRALAAYIKRTRGISVDPTAIFDVQIKRLHAYKRQLLHLLRIIDQYQQLKAGLDIGPKHVHIFAAKAAPGYYYAKEIIKVINAVADLINHDTQVNRQLQVVFLPNYSVSLAERIIAGADVSEQISLAGKEASGTSNMKLMATGALTLATMDGANIEIYHAVGADNIMTFGLTSDQVQQHQRDYDYSARDLFDRDARVHRIVSALIDGTIPGIEVEGRDIYQSLLQYNDEYFVLADLEAYLHAGAALDAIYQEPERWAQMVVANLAASGRFSSDLTVAGYARDIWHVTPMTGGRPHAI